MVSFNQAIKKARYYLARPANIPAAIALVVMICCSIYAEDQNNKVYRKNLEADVLNQVSLIRSRLEGSINANIQLVRGLVATIVTEPYMDQNRFAELSASLFATDNQLKLVAAAPNLVVSMVYPVRGNEDALGLNYNENADQRDAALRARDAGDLILAGPVNLVQGGTGFIGRFPVYISQPSGHHAFWGIVSAVVDAESLYVTSGLENHLPLDVTIRGRDGLGANGPLFFGSPEKLDADPVLVNVQLPSGTWQIAATPKGGWDAVPPNQWAIRLAALLAIALVVLPILGAGWLVGERFDTLRKLKLNKRQMERMSRRLELALKTSEIGVWENDLSKGNLFWDKRMRELYGADPEKPLTYLDWEKRLHPDDLERAVKEFNESIANKSPYASEFRVLAGAGQVRTIRAMGNVQIDPDGNARIFGVNWDISRDVQLNEQLRQAKLQSEARNAALEQAKASIEFNALHDSLTGLPNRRFLDEVLSGQSKVKLPDDGGHSLLHIDLDRFKQINDTLGHAAGDVVLAHVASVLMHNVRATDFVARIGGDEFVIICMSDADHARLAELAARLVEKMREPILYNGRECRIGVSIGVASNATNSGKPQQLLINADIALYKAKESGRNNFQFFSEDLHLAAVNTKRIADEILTGIEQKQFVTHYQGQFDAKTHQISGVEALVRWQHPERGLLAPHDFLDVAEDINVMATIDGIVLEQAIAQLESWSRADIHIPQVSVNVSARRLHDEKLIEGLKALTFKPGTLTFELVESTFLDSHEDMVAWNIDQIRELGIDIEVDDFGTGYASIVSLMQLRPKRLKVDRQLVMPITQSAGQRELVRSIVQIGSSLGIGTVAEGVETMEHADILEKLGCQTLQGYVFAKPMSGRAFANFVRKSNWGVIKAA